MCAPRSTEPWTPQLWPQKQTFKKSIIEKQFIRHSRFFNVTACDRWRNCGTKEMKEAKANDCLAKMKELGWRWLIELNTFYCTNIICIFRIDKERNSYLSQVKQKPKNQPCCDCSERMYLLDSLWSWCPRSFTYWTVSLSSTSKLLPHA